MNGIKYFFLVVFIFPFSCAAQTSAETAISSLKDSLAAWTKSMQRGENDSVRNAAAASFRNSMQRILEDSSSFSASFDSIKNVSAKTAPDNSFRLYTWTYPNNDGSKYYYFGYLQSYNAKTKKTNLFELLDSSDVIEKPQSKKLKPDKWYGAVYYDILKNVRDKKSYYTLLGWHGINSLFTQKLADVLYFESGKPVFGYPLFKAGKISHNRVIFQFDARAVMTLKYDEDRRLLVFDHIANRGGNLGPDGTYDAYKFTKKGRWELMQDVDVNAGFKPKPAPKPVPDQELKDKDREMKEKK
jgi:hypothetical protein